MAGYDITDLQAVDFALGGVFAGCYGAMAKDASSKAFQRFLARPDKERIFLVKNDNVQDAMRKLAKFTDEPKSRGSGRAKKAGPDLPAILYYREQGITADQNQHIQVAEVTRFDDQETIWAKDKAMRVTTIPLTLTYSVLFLAWDRASIEAMALAWWAYVAPLHRQHSRFLVPYTLDGEQFEVGASISSPREILTSSEPVDDDRRLWGSRTMVEVNTQAVYGAKVERHDYLTIVGDWRLIP